MVYKTIKQIVFLILLGTAFPIGASFSVVCQDPPCSPYSDPETVRFRYALDGQCPAPEEEPPCCERENDRYYVRFRISASSLILNSIKNKSTAVNQPGAVVKRRAVRNQAGLEFALGYIWFRGIRGDIEYLANKDLSYFSNPGLTGVGVTPGQLFVHIKNNTLLANAYYELNDIGLDCLKPYITGGLGVAVNSTNAVLSPTPAGTTGANTVRTWGLAYAIGAGARLGIYPRWYIDLSYRYIGIGTPTIQPVNSYKLRSPYGMNAFSIGLIILL